MTSKLVLEKSANEFRHRWGMGADDPIRLKSLLTKLNVITVFKDLNSDFSGMALKVTKEDFIARFILINSNHPLGKQHFTICHEIYHLYVQAEFSSMVCNAGQFDKKDGEEYNADVFASNLLLPETGIKALIPDDEISGKDKISLKTILKIEHYFSCSRAALLYRLKEIGILTSSLYDVYNKNVQRGALQYGYSTDLYNKANKGVVLGNYGELARDLFDKNKISESHYISLLTDWGLSEEQLEKLLNGSED
jgi:Zn-dependent peptidase ImmA (M78 family)